MDIILDDNVVLPDEIDLRDESEDEDYGFNFDQEEARRERAEVNYKIRELILKGLWIQSDTV